MGGTGSVLQHERKIYGRTEETRLLKLYNRQNREDKLSGKLRAVGIENFEVGVGSSPNLGPPYPGRVIGLDGKGTPLLREKTQTSAYRDRDQWPKRVANLLRVSEICTRRPTTSTTTAAAAAVAEKKQRRRGERLRARESVMIQMYNSIHHADLDSSLASLRRSFQQCSIQGGGWATAPAVSAALKEAGVTVSDPVVLILANQDGYAERAPPRSAKNIHQNNPGTPTAEDKNYAEGLPQSAKNILEKIPTPTTEEDKRFAEGPLQSARDILQNNPTPTAEEEDKHYAEGPLQSAKNILQNNPAQNNPAAPAEAEDRLVYWPSILDFLEAGPSDNTPNDDDAVNAVGHKDGLDSAIMSMGGESPPQKDARQSGVMHPLDGNYRCDGRTNTVPATPVKPTSSSVSVLAPLDGDEVDNDSEESFEPDTSGGCGGGGGGGASGFVLDDNHAEQTTGGGRGQSSEVTESGGRRCPLEQGPRNVKDGLRAAELNGGKGSISPRGVHDDTVGRTQGVPSKEARGMMCGEYRPEEKDTFPVGGGEEEGVDQRQLGCARGAFLEKGFGNGDTVGDDVGGAKSTNAFRDPIDAESLVNAACVAGKKGDASAINDLADRVDLRRNDAFGRNALYYACLCGHAGVAHLVAARAYGGVEGIPENERWECRKNALSEEIRNYLDTGFFPEPVSYRRGSRERRAVQAPASAAGGRECSTTSNIKGSSRGFIECQEGVSYREGIGGEGLGNGVRHTPPVPANGGRECGLTSNIKGSRRGFVEGQERVNYREGVDSVGSASGVRHTPRTPADGGRERGLTPNPKGSSRGFIESQEGGNCRERVDCQVATSGRRCPPRADEAFSIASLFDSARDQEENGDY